MTADETPNSKFSVEEDENADETPTTEVRPLNYGDKGATIEDDE